MKLGRSIVLTVVGAFLIGSGLKVYQVAKKPEPVAVKSLPDLVVFHPELLDFEKSLPTPDPFKTTRIKPEDSARDAVLPNRKYPVNIGEVPGTKATELPEIQTTVVVFSPTEHPLGKIKPKARSTDLAAEKMPRPKHRIAQDVPEGLEKSPRPKARTAKFVARNKPKQTTVLALAEPQADPKPNPSLIRLTPTRNASAGCATRLTRAIPRRSAGAMSGSQIVKKAINLSGAERDAFVSGQLLAGNIPRFLRNLTPVAFNGKSAKGQAVQVIICVTPDYLAAGNDRDFVRVPMGLPAAAKVADKFGFLLPTTKMVDAIYAQARVQMSPSPMQASSRMSSTSYLREHNQTVEGQRVALSRNPDLLTAGQKKDLVLSNRLRSAPGRVAIYGWHRRNGAPIQPLSTVHGALYADYSHGIRLISATAYVNGNAVPLARLLEDPTFAAIISKEGPIARPRRLMASLYRR